MISSILGTLKQFWHRSRTNIFFFLGGGITNFNCRDQDLAKCSVTDCLLIPGCARQLMISNTRLICKLRAYCRNSITSRWYFAVTESTFSAFEFTCNVPIQNQMHYAEYKRSVPSSVALLPNSVHCVHRWTIYAILPKSAALLPKCLLIVIIWLEKDVCPQIKEFPAKSWSTQQPCLIYCDAFLTYLKDVDMAVPILHCPSSLVPSSSDEIFVKGRSNLLIEDLVADPI